MGCANPPHVLPSGFSSPFFFFFFERIGPGRQEKQGIAQHWNLEQTQPLVRVTSPDSVAGRGARQDPQQGAALEHPGLPETEAINRRGSFQAQKDSSSAVTQVLLLFRGVAETGEIPSHSGHLAGHVAP